MPVELRGPYPTRFWESVGVISILITDALKVELEDDCAIMFPERKTNVITSELNRLALDGNWLRISSEIFLFIFIHFNTVFDSG